MASDPSTDARPQDGGKAAAAKLARDLVRRAWKATLGTLERAGGHPYASLVAVAAQPDGSPLLLLSGLAEHTKNIEADQRVSLLIDGTSGDRAALTGARVTLVGRIREADAAGSRLRYLNRHPDAANFIDFADFKLYAIDIEWAHLVAGFGRIVRLRAGEVLSPTGDAAEVIEAEASILQHMNEDHSDAIAAIADSHATEDGSAAGGSIAQGDWRMIGCDPDGFDLTDGQRALRVVFPARVTTTEAVRSALVHATRTACSRSDG